MPVEFQPGCKRPEIAKPQVEITLPTMLEGVKEVKTMRVGKPAPEFTAPGYFQGKFANFSLSEYKGKWVLLCFYPGDFTFV